jgi:hypothetical protein
LSGRQAVTRGEAVAKIENYRNSRHNW